MKARACLWLLVSASICLADRQIGSAPSVGPASANVRANDPLAAPGEHFRPRLGALGYQVLWRSAVAGELTFNIDRRDNRYTLALRGESNEQIDRIYKVRYQAISQLSANPFLPLRAVYRENVQNDRKHFTADFHPEGRITVVRDRNRPGRDPSKTVYDLRPEKFAVDALSGLCLIMKTDWKEGMTLNFEVVFGKDRFDATLRCVGRARMDVMGIRREAWVIAVDMAEIEEDGASNAPKDADAIAKDAVRIYLSNDPYREILRLTGNTPLGDVQVRLRRFSPLKPPAQP